MPTLVKSGRKLTERQIDLLKVLKRAPKTTTKATEQLAKKNPLVRKSAVRGCMRTLEDRALVRARTFFDKKLKRDIIIWELTAKGRKAVTK